MAEPEMRALSPRRFRALVEIGKALATEQSLEELLRSVAREACTFLDATSCSIMLLDQTGGRLLTAASFGLATGAEREISFRKGEGVAGWVAQSGKAARVDDVDADPRFVVSPRQRIAILALLCAPLQIQAECIGVMSLSHDSKPFAAEAEALAQALCDTIVGELGAARLRRLRYTDAATGALSKAALEAALQREIAHARRVSGPLSVVLFEIDPTPARPDATLNDDAIVGIATLLRGALRFRDAVFRFDANQFLVLAVGLNRARAHAVAERVRRTVAEEAKRAGTPAAALSVGVTTLRNDDGSDGAALVRRVEEATRQARKAGGDRVEVV